MGVGVLVKWCGVVGEGEAIPSPIIEHLKVKSFAEKIHLHIAL